MQVSRVWQEPVTFKTYLTGKQDQHPIFLEHRVYQGSSGAVYPYGVTDTLLDKVEDRTYQALYLENDFIKVMILPELGGRVHRAYDKVNGRDFVYFNHVVKPALVGLLGPWISGGIEFNWPQHHRPTTFMPVDFSMKENEDGSATVFVGEREAMHGLSVTTAFTLYPDKALLEIKSRVFNTTDTPRSFLWWSNPAVKGGDGHQSVFPPDVTAVFDHGKRAVIDFPIAHGEYYKVKYDGTDISRYKNLPVPTSYMAWRSDYDFVGAYCHDEDGGLLHVADHHVSPGKKQWTWGYGDFGQAWDRNLTDEDGPYIELMTGVYTDNQPDFTWLEPGEEKEFVQNFMPYSKLGMVQNACEKAAVKMEREKDLLKLGVYAVQEIHATAEVSDSNGHVLFSKDIDLTPCKAVQWQESAANISDLLTFTLKDNAGQTIISYTEHEPKPVPLPETAPNPPFPEEILSTDEAYFIGQHLEQYHHASRNSFDYYKRALEIDPLDYRCNVAMGNYEYNRCNYTAALEYADNALKRAHMLNRNSACGLGSVLRANCLVKLGRDDEAYDEYFRATWSYNGRTKGYLGLGFISLRRGDFKKAFYFAQRSMQTESTNQEAMCLKVFASFEDKCQDAEELLSAAQQCYPLNPVLSYFKAHYLHSAENGAALDRCLNGREINFITVTEFLLKAGRKELALGFLKGHNPQGAIANLMFAALTEDKDVKAQLQVKARDEFDNFVRFPNLMIERDLLDTLSDDPFALHLCASFDYSHRLYEKAVSLWQKCVKIDETYAEAWRGLGIYYFNKQKDTKKALECYAKALQNAKDDERILFENDLLMNLSLKTPEERLEVLKQHNVDTCLRDDLKAEFVTLLNQTMHIDEASKILSEREFHVWEGGEGRVTGQYINNAVLKANRAAMSDNYGSAYDNIISALTFPHNLGEGKLVVQTDNDLYFFAALYASKLGNKERTEQFLSLAMRGDVSITEQRYYNDLPVDYVFYNALSRMVCGKQDEAKQIFTAMKDWSNSNFNKEAVEDFFAVSLPDLVVFDRDLNRERKENCLLMKALGSLGLGEESAFDESLNELAALHPSNFKISLYKTLKAQLLDVVKNGLYK